MVHAIVVRAALALAGLAVPLLLIEFTLRVFGPVLPGNYETGVWAEGHPTIGHVHVPGATAWIKEPEFTTYLRFNQYGLRGAETRVPKPSDRYRILLLGDSFIEGKQVRERATLCERLNALLADGGRDDVRALNAGVFDWSQVHEYLYLREAAPVLQPNLVVQFLYVGNDIGDLWPRSRGELRDLERPLVQVDGDGQLEFMPWQRHQPTTSERFQGYLSRRSSAWRAFDTGVMDKIRYGARDGQGIEGQMLELFRFKESPPEARAWQAVDAMLARTQELAAQSGARYAVVVIPTKWQVHKEDWLALLAAHGEEDDDRWVMRGPQKHAVQLAQARGIPVLDLLPALRNAARQGERLYYAVDTHWRPEGHDQAARAVLEFLQKSELLTPQEAASIQH